MPGNREADDGPRRFIRTWLRYDEHGPRRVRTMWKLLATVAVLLASCALLAFVNGLLTSR
jgi:hypothetical protein